MDEPQVSKGLVLGQARGDLIGGPSKLASLLLESVHVRGVFDRDDVARRYLDWWNAEGFDTGPIAAEVFDPVSQGVEIDAAVRQVDTTHDGMTAGCAPIHRNVVLASVPFIADADLEEYVRQETRLTHHHPLAADTAVAAIRIARQLARGVAWGSALDAGKVGLADEAVSAIERWRRPPSDRSGYSSVVLHAALHFVGTSDTFERALERSVEFSGDDNYVPVLTGALAGARWGC